MASLCWSLRLPAGLHFSGPAKAHLVQGMSALVASTDRVCPGALSGSHMIFSEQLLGLSSSVFF